MKNIVAAMIAIALIVPTVVAISTIGSIVDISLAKYDPFPAGAGTVTTVYFDVANKGQELARNITITLVTPYPFSLPNNDPERTILLLPGSDSKRIEYSILTNQNAKNGTYTMTTESLEGSFKKTKNFNMTVRETTSFNKADVVPLFVKTDPEPYPAGTTTLTIDITNVDRGTAFYVIAMASSDMAEIDRNEIFVGTLEPNDFVSTDFSLKIKDGVAPGLYPVNITTVYKDKNSNEIEQSGIVYMKVISAQDARALEIAPTPVWVYVIYLLGLAIIVKFAVLPVLKRVRKK